MAKQGQPIEQSSKTLELSFRRLSADRQLQKPAPRLRGLGRWSQRKQADVQRPTSTNKYLNYKTLQNKGTNMDQPQPTKNQSLSEE